MFPSKEFWLIAVLGGVIGGMTSVLLLKLLEKKEATQKKTKGPDNWNEFQKRPQEHDERLCLATEEKLTTCCPCGNCRAFDRDLPRETSTVGEEKNKGCALLTRWLPDEIDDQLRGELYEGLIEQYGTVDFTYSSVKELHELVRLHHEVQLLCLQLHVKHLAGEKLLPLLETLNPLDSSFVPLYRITHGLLCGDGKVFPAMVLDNF